MLGLKLLDKNQCKIHLRSSFSARLIYSISHYFEYKSHKTPNVIVSTKIKNNP